MNFFEQQAQARRRTVWLVCGFFLGLMLVVVCIFELTNLVVRYLPALGYQVSEQVPLWCASGAGGLICLGAYLGWTQIDGAGLAVRMGARPLPLTSTDPAERQYLHVVQEMAIAAGCAVPGMYVFEDEAINAFAAGGTPETAVIAVSRGALTLLTREELQALVAHEFSHIFNGDMRLNMRMLGALAGLMLIGVVGRVLWRRRSAQYLLYAIVLIVLGALGLWVAQIIKAAVSRQREFLADASAVQFTRNPAGLYGALRKVDRRGSVLLPAMNDASSADPPEDAPPWMPEAEGAHEAMVQAQLQAVYAQLMSHFFFAPAQRVGMDDWLATHPSVQERLNAIDPQGLLAFERPSKTTVEPHPQNRAQQHLVDGAAIPLLAAERNESNPVALAVGQGELQIAQALRERIPDVLKRRLEIPAGAAAVVQGMLLSVRPFVKQAQRDILVEHCNAVMAEAALRAQVQMVNLPQAMRLPLLDMAMPALRALARDEQETFLKTVNLLVLADGKVNAFELAAQVLIQRNLRPDKTVLTPGTAAQHMRVVLSYIALCGARGDGPAARQAYWYALHRSSTLRLRNMLGLEDCEPQAVRRSVLALAGMSPLEKRSFIAAVQACAIHDQVIHVSEWEIVRVLCQCLEMQCPLAPPGLDARVFVS